jgi:hypothetical protein
MYEVLHWGSHPEDGNDDCHQGWDFDSFNEALAKFEEGASYRTAFIELVLPNQSFVRKNEAFDPLRCAADARREEAEWRREIATQSGMMSGCEAYNEEMGW